MGSLTKSQAPPPHFALSCAVPIHFAGSRDSDCGMGSPGCPRTVNSATRTDPLPSHQTLGVDAGELRRVLKDYTTAV